MQASPPTPGASVWIRQRRWTVERARVDRSVLRLDVASGAQRLTFLAPFDRPVLAHRHARPTTVRRQQALARVARALGVSHPFDLPQTALRAPIDVLSYQLEPTLAVLAGVRRILIADDVGLGKTIQAGLVLAELHHRRTSCRALVIVPAPLIDQWVSELRDRFSLEATAVYQDTLDRESLQLVTGSTPWDRSGIWIASPDYLKQRHVLDGIPHAPWDVVIIDEAHGVAGDSDRHEACHDLAQRSRRVILLTATPHSGDDDRFRRLLALGQLSREDDAIRVFRRSRADVAQRPAPVARWPRVTTGPAAQQVLDALMTFERTVLRGASAGQRPSAQLLLSVLRKRAASTLHALDQSLERRLEWLQAPDRAYRLDWLQPPLPFLEGEEEAHDGEERRALVGESGLQASHERTWLRRLRLLCAAALPRDPKVQHLTALLARSHEPAVVFTEYRASLDCLQKRLGETRAVAALHGGLTARERRGQLKTFLDGHASVLLATDVGGQGLNLQSRGRWVINVDVPWNPARLHQRVGRVDRIGQTRRVHTTTLSLPHIVEHHVMETMARREQRSRQVMGVANIDGVAAAAADRRSDPARTSAEASAIAVCSAFRRRSRAMAAALVSKRRWMKRWRGASEPRPCRTRCALPGETDRKPGVTVVVMLPIVDAAGVIVEQQVRVMRLAHEPKGRPDLCVLASAIGRVLAQSMDARLRHLRRALSTRCAADVSIEAAVGEVLHALIAPEEMQLALFSQRERVDFDRGRQSLVAADTDRTGWLADLKAAATVTCGDPVVLAMFEARR